MSVFEEFYTEKQLQSHDNIEDGDRKLFYSSTPDCRLKEQMTILHLKQSLILKGYDLVAIPKTDDADLSYDYIVMGQRSHILPIRCQHKSSTSWIAPENARKQKKIPNTYVFDINRDQVLNSYDMISIFSLYAGRTIVTSQGPKYEYSIYFIDRNDLLERFTGNSNNTKLYVDPNDPEWIKLNGNVSIFAEYEMLFIRSDPEVFEELKKYSKKDREKNGFYVEQRTSLRA